MIYEQQPYFELFLIVHQSLVLSTPIVQSKVGTISTQTKQQDFLFQKKHISFLFSCPLPKR